MQWNRKWKLDNMAKVKIFLEAESLNVPESKFVVSILKHMGINPDRYDLMPTGGYSNLMDSDSTTNVGILQANTDEGGINLVIFDADSPQNNGGFEKRREELLKRKKEMGLTFELFLWPNNKDDGDVEVLMESIARKDLYPQLFECYEKYEHCISQRKNEQGDAFYHLPNRKNKLHTYFTSLPISQTKRDKAGKGDWLWDDSEIWNLDADTMNPIKEFLSKQFI